MVSAQTKVETNLIHANYENKNRPAKGKEMKNPRIMNYTKYIKNVHGYKLKIEIHSRDDMMKNFTIIMHGQRIDKKFAFNIVNCSNCRHCL